MLVCLGTHSKDIADAKRLLLWIAKLGDHRQHSLLIAVDAGTPFDEVMVLRELAEGIFREVRVTTNTHSVSGWPAGANSLFKTAATYVHQKWPQPFLWLESDCVPLIPSWLDALDFEYVRNGKKFLGYIYQCSQAFLPDRVMSAIAVYPNDAVKLLPDLPQSPRAWDVDGDVVMISNGAHTPFIYHLWGQQNLPPTFVAQKTPQSPINAMTPEDIPKEAVLFHRCKNSSLINLLERKLFPEEFKNPLVVCFPVHAGDIGLAIQHANWLRVLKRRWPNEALICHDPSAPVVLLNQFEQLLRHSFETVNSFVYHRPGIPSYPHAANWMFQNIALHMAKQKNPWFLMEADGVVLKADWLEQIQNEYHRSGMSWMGSVVPHMGHMNGCGIYPANAAERMPRAMRATEQAWDMLAKDEIIAETHDASHLLFHVWTVMADGTPSPVGGGNVPANLTAEWARRFVPASSVFVHRIKTDSLIRDLVSGARL